MSETHSSCSTRIGLLRHVPSLRVAACGLAWVLLTTTVTVHGQARPPQSPDFVTGTTLVRTDVIVRDQDGNFVADLAPTDFIVEEDGVPQDVASLVLVHGGRVYNQLTPPPPIQEGIILPAARPRNDTAGRVIVFFIDELHLNPHITAKVRHFIKEVAEAIVHEGDLVALVGNGPANTAIDLTYDRTLLHAAADNIIGRGLGPRELIEDLQRGYRGQDELRWNAHRAFYTVNDVLGGLETLEDRRKIILYISTGYDLNPLALQRLYRSNRDDRFLRERPSDLASQYTPEMQAEIEARNPIEYIERSQAVFADGQLLQEITELTDVANRTNTTFYTMDPRGLISSPDIDYDVPFQAWQEFMLAQRSSLRTLAELTGGFAIVNTNNFDEMLARIDAETSDYYVLGYYASNPDPTDRTRRLNITVSRPDLAVQSRTSYTFRRPEVPGAP